MSDEEIEAAAREAARSLPPLTPGEIASVAGLLGPYVRREAT